MSEIKPGARVTVTTADGDELPKRAVSGVEPGSTFEVVWVAKPEEWDSANAEGRPPDALPWPASAVTVSANG